MSVLGWCRERPWTWALGAGLCTGLAGYGAGRFAAPTKVETREREVTVYRADEKAIAHAVSEARSTWEREVRDNTRIETRYVDGKPSVRIEYRDRDTTSSGGKVETRTVEVVVEKKVEVEKLVEVEKIVTREAPRLTLGATLGYDHVLTYGGYASVRVLGPLSLLAQGEAGQGVWSARAGVGLAF